MRFQKALVFVFTAAALLCFALPGLASQVKVEIVSLGTYPDAALPPGEVDQDVYDVSNVLSYTTYVKLSATAYPGWVFVGWKFDDAFYQKHQEPSVNQYQESGGVLWESCFEIFNSFTVKAVYTYIGPGSIFYELEKMNPGPAQSGEAETTYEVGVYERDPVSVDGDYGAIFCYPNAYSEKMDVPAGSTILLAAVPHDGYQFSNWAVFKEGQAGFEQPTTDVLAFKADTAYSIDAIFKPAPQP